MQGGHHGDGSPAQRVVDLLLTHGWEADGQTMPQSYRTGSASNPIYGGMGGRIVHTGGRDRFKKPGTFMKATVGKLTCCFYEVENGKTKYACNIKTRDLPRITQWARTEVCFHRFDAVRLGKESEWLQGNAHWLESADGPAVSNGKL